MTARESYRDIGRDRVRAEAGSDLLAWAIALAAILMLIPTASRALAGLVAAILDGTPIDRFATSTLLLNLAVALFAWRRHAQLRREKGERDAAEQRATFLASRDPLTGLLNRGSLVDLGDALIRDVLPAGGSVALILVDLDRFKNVNDVHGHDAGDLILARVAETIAATMGQGALCARLGSDEFAVAFPFEPADRAGATHLAELLIGRLGRAFEIGEGQVHLSASIGIAALGGDCGDMAALLRQADIAMYAAKNGGRNRAVWFDAGMESALRARGEIEEGLRSGIPAGEFVPHYQPQFDLTTGRLVGFEVLARWINPARGTVEPDRFIPVAEECGIIDKLSESVIEQALREARSWDPALTLSVNISPMQLKDAWLAQKLLKLLAETGFPAERLEIEITESSLFENLGLAQSIVASLKNQGIRLALDDFGTGYSSLAHLRALPFDRIKIDRSFVQSMNKDPESLAIIKAVTGLGQSLGIDVTAEGIEDSHAAERLRELGCDLAQGWHFGRPLTGAEARTLIAAQAERPAEPATIVDFAREKAAVRARRSAGK